ncbi:P-loop NTPase domain-containing protein [Pandoravirus kuranda]|uniref:P-loop NTPase domain-containing protein n=1 Tax=Pandoravirus kuranda TaxID=3019033 RepID=A0AA95J476_9VIRU|nr:P-loop NTPase domain-containing protein [Pandoravirus kuranda]
MAHVPIALVLVPLILASIGRLAVAAYINYRAARQRPFVSHTLYDLCVGIDSMANLLDGGWVVRAPSLRGEPLLALKRCIAVRPDKRTMPSVPCAGEERDAFECDRTEPSPLDDGDKVRSMMTKAVAFVGRRGAGKTFCVNRLYGLGLADGPLHPTPGLSITWPTAPHLPAVVDTAGDGAPTPAGDVDAAHDRRLTDGLVRDLALQCVDQAVMVVDSMTTAVQEDIDALARQMAQRGMRHLFVLHNMRYAETMVEADRMWKDNVTDVYASVGHLEHTGDLRLGHFVSEIDGVRVYHMRVAREGSDAGNVLNKHTLALLRARLDALGVARPFDPCGVIRRHLDGALSRLVIGPIGIEWHPEGLLAEDAIGGQDGAVCRIRPAAGRAAAQVRLRAVRPETNTTDHLVDAMGNNDSESDFDAPVEVLNKGNHLVVHIDVPGVDVGSLTVTSVASAHGQYAEVRGLRAPIDSNTPKTDSDMGDRHAPTGPAQGKRASVPSCRILERPTRFGRMCVRIAMPPGSHIDPTTVVCAGGILSFVIRRQVEPVLVPVSTAPASLVCAPVGA